MNKWGDANKVGFFPLPLCMSGHGLEQIFKNYEEQILKWAKRKGESTLPKNQKNKTYG